MSDITLESLLKECDLDENDLNAKIEKEHFSEISRSLTNWSELVLKLPAFDEGAVADIEANKHREEERRLEFLKQLKQRLSFNATYGLLVRNLLEIKRADDAQNLCRHLKNLIGSKSDGEVATAQLEELKKENETLEKKFDEVVEVVQTSFIERDVKFNKILSSLLFIKCPEEKQMVKEQFKLFEAQSLPVLFFSFSDIWDYIHPGLLEFIVEKFGTTSDKNVVKEYKEDLKKYRGSVKLGEFVKIICKRPKPPLFNKELSTIVGEDWRHKTLQDLEDVRLQFADKSKCDRLLLRALPKQSHFTIVFSMPSWIQLNLVEMYPAFTTIGATKVYLNNDYIYECVPLKKKVDEKKIGKESVIGSKMEKLQGQVSKEMISHFPYISDSDFEILIIKVFAYLKENDVIAILALRKGRHKIYTENILLHMFCNNEIMKFSPNSFQTLLKKIERNDLIPIVDDFYKNCTKPKIITEKTIDQQFISLDDFMTSITSSLWALEIDYTITSLTSLSSELENIFYQAYNMNESIQNAILEFSEKQSIDRRRPKFGHKHTRVKTADPSSIRPMPEIAIRGMGGFVMCDGLRCSGISCTFAHSREEQTAWNSELHKLRIKMSAEETTTVMSLDELKSKVPTEKQDIHGNPQSVKEKIFTSIYEDQDTEDHAKPSEEDSVMSIRVEISGKSQKIVHGKWVLFEKMDSIDETWGMIVEAIKKDELGGCIEAKCSTRLFNPTEYGPGPITSHQISVYTSEDNKMEVGEKLIHVVQRDIRYKLERDIQSGRYRHKDSDLKIENYYYNNGHPSATLEGNKCPGFTDDGEDKWRLNIVECPKLQSEDIFGYWELVIEDELLTTLWHYLKDRIHSEENSLGAIKMVCPKKLTREDKPTFQVFTSKSQMLDTGLTLLQIMEKDIKFIELESGCITKVIWNRLVDRFQYY